MSMSNKIGNFVAITKFLFTFSNKIQTENKFFFLSSLGKVIGFLLPLFCVHYFSECKRQIVQ